MGFITNKKKHFKRTSSEVIHKNAKATCMSTLIIGTALALSGAIVTATSNEPSLKTMIKKDPDVNIEDSYSYVGECVTEYNMDYTDALYEWLANSDDENARQLAAEYKEAYDNARKQECVGLGMGVVGSGSIGAAAAFFEKTQKNSKKKKEENEAERSECEGQQRLF